MNKKLIAALMAVALLSGCSGAREVTSGYEETEVYETAEQVETEPMPDIDISNMTISDILSPVTNITGNADSSEKATVMQSSIDVRNTARVYIKEEDPESYTDLDNPEAITLYYDDEIILVYKGEEDVTYVQASSRKYVHQNGFRTIYRPYRSSIFWYSNKSYEKKYYKTDNERYGRGGYTISNTPPADLTPKPTTTSKDSGKIKTGQNESRKVKTNSSWDSLKTNNSNTSGSSGSGSVRTGSTGTRTSIGGGTSFGK